MVLMRILCWVRMCLTVGSHFGHVRFEIRDLAASYERILVQRHALHDRVLIPSGEAFLKDAGLSALYFDVPRVDEMDAFMCKLPYRDVGVVLSVRG